MATARPKRKSGLKRAPAKRTPRKAKPGTRGLSPGECRLDSLSGDAEEARVRIAREGGLVVGAYSDPLGKNALLLAILPIERIEPTPFQRDLSQTHHRKLADVLDRTGRFLDRALAGADNPMVRGLERFSEEPLSKAIKAHEQHADMLMDLDARVAEVIAKLKARGFVSPYLRAFVVARINPLRWIQGEAPPLEEVLKTMRERAAKFNTERIKQEDLASAGGAPDTED